MYGRRQFVLGLAAAATVRGGAARTDARVPRVGMVSGSVRSLENFLAGLRDVGHVPGQTIVIDHKVTSGEADRYDGAIVSLLRAGADLLVVTSPHGIMAARRRTGTVPIVAVDLESDPVASNFVASLARPGSNLAGFFLDLPEVTGKLVQLIQEAKPGLSRVGVMWDAAIARAQMEATERAAHASAIEVRPAPIRIAGDIGTPSRHSPVTASERSSHCHRRSCA